MGMRPGSQLSSFDGITSVSRRLKERPSAGHAEPPDDTSEEVARQ